MNRRKLDVKNNLGIIFIVLLLEFLATSLVGHYMASVNSININELKFDETFEHPYSSDHKTFK